MEEKKNFKKDKMVSEKNIKTNLHDTAKLNKNFYKRNSLFERRPNIKRELKRKISLMTNRINFIDSITHKNEKVIKLATEKEDKLKKVKSLALQKKETLRKIKEKQEEELLLKKKKELEKKKKIKKKKKKKKKKK